MIDALVHAGGAALVAAALLGQQASGAGDAELAKQLQNPIANLISVPIKLDWDTNIGTADAHKSTYIVQPVIPI